MPEKHDYEFLGPPGALLMSFGLPVICYAFALLCNDVSGCPTHSILHPMSLTLAKLKQDIRWQGLATIFSWKTFFVNLGWYGSSLILYAVLPATESEGTVLSNGQRLKYRFNGLYSYVLSYRAETILIPSLALYSALVVASILAAGTFAQGADFVVWIFIWDNHVRLLTSNIILVYFLATYVYLASYRGDRELAAGGQSGNILYDWFIGRELNPRINIPLIGNVDIKCWMEMRPGLLGWIMFDCAFIAAQYRHYGYVTDSIVLVTVAQGIYVFDALYMEPAILTTIDIVSDGFGTMLALGDIVWVPFTFSLHTRYLAMHPVTLGYYNCVVLGVLAMGYWVFRSSNNEKNRFRINPNDPSIKHLQYIETTTGSRLLVGGWWGMARHINYFGDWIMSWSFCLPTGIAGYQVYYGASADALTTMAGHPNDHGLPPGAHIMIGTAESIVVVPGEARGLGMAVTYFYLLYFAVLLIHRERRDEQKCKRKYGHDWERYKKKVPWRIIPGLY